MQRVVAVWGLVLVGALAGLAQAAPSVQFQTSAGEFVIELQPEKAPKTVENFLQYVNDKHYEGTIFHRVIDGFMVQGGGFTAAMVQKPTRAPIPLEAANGLRNDRGTIAMARTGISAHYADRAWDDYVADGIFPVDGNVSTEALQSLINISGLIRALPNRIKTTADDYINRRYWQDALAGLG
jgi:hypothetical protein